MDPQVTLTMPILPGIDGVEKMSKSLDNFIGISDPPREIFGKTMRIPDGLIHDYFLLTTDLPAAELAAIKVQLADPSTNPSLVKRRLARTLVTLYVSEDDAWNAEREFDRMFKEKEAPEEIPECALAAPDGTIGIIQLLTESGLVPSKSEARRMIEHGAVSIDGAKVADQHAVVALRDSVVVRVGKRGFRRVRRA